MTTSTETFEPTGTDLIVAVLRHVRAREGTAAARKVAVQMLFGLLGILCVELGRDKLSDLLSDAEACAHVAADEHRPGAH